MGYCCMANRLFISFKAENKPNVDGLRLLAKNPNYDLEFYDESVRAPINWCWDSETWITDGCLFLAD